MTGLLRVALVRFRLWAVLPLIFYGCTTVQPQPELPRRQPLPLVEGREAVSAQEESGAQAEVGNPAKVRSESTPRVRDYTVVLPPPRPRDLSQPPLEGAGTAREPEQGPPAFSALAELPPDDHAELAPFLTGEASWYGPDFHGKRTAGGEIYNQYALTAAHPVLPMNTHVEVENLGNRRRIWVRINDRGPYKKGRILDLSRRAARLLGMIKEGTALVRIRVLRWPETMEPSLGLKPYRQFVVQLAAYPLLGKAERHLRHLKARFRALPLRLDTPPSGVFAVVAGPYEEEQAARQVAHNLQREGITSLVRRLRK